MKLQAKQGGNMRQYYTFFEIEALKEAFVNNYEAGKSYSFGKTAITFTVITNSDTEISVERGDNGKRIEANKVERATRVRMPETYHQPESQTEKIPEKEDDDLQPKSPETDETDNYRKIGEMFAKMMGKHGESVDYAKIEKMIDDKVTEKVAESKSFSVTVNNAPEVKMDGTPHNKFKEVLFWAASRQPVYLFGPAGTGKNVLAQQVAKALNLNFYYAGCLQFKSDLEGFVNAAGEYVETDFYKAFTQGGVFLLDEIDGTSAEVLVAFGAALANRYYNFPKYGRVEAHPDFIVLAAGNTAGRGATESYNGRYQLDASTLDRFTFVELEYDYNIELSVAGGDAELVNFAHDLRDAIKLCGLTYTVSTRAIKRISLGMQCPDIDQNTLFMSALCAGWDHDDLNQIQGIINNTDNNKYTSIFKNIR